MTFNFGNLQILNTQATPNQVTSSFGSNGQQIPFFNLLENGQVIATSNNITLTDISPYSFVPLTQKIDVALNGISGNPFFQEVNQLTNGTGILEFNGTTPIGIGSTTAYGGFTFTGNVAPLSVSQPNIPSVPEPDFSLGALVAIGALIVRTTGKQVKRWSIPVHLKKRQGYFYHKRA